MCPQSDARVCSPAFAARCRWGLCRLHSVGVTCRGDRLARPVPSSGGAVSGRALSRGRQGTGLLSEFPSFPEPVQGAPVVLGSEGQRGPPFALQGVVGTHTAQPLGGVLSASSAAGVGDGGGPGAGLAPRLAGCTAADGRCSQPLGEGSAICCLGAAFLIAGSCLLPGVPGL